MFLESFRLSTMLLSMPLQLFRRVATACVVAASPHSGHTCVVDAASCRVYPCIKSRKQAKPLCWPQICAVLPCVGGIVLLAPVPVWSRNAVPAMWQPAKSESCALSLLQISQRLVTVLQIMLWGLSLFYSGMQKQRFSNQLCETNTFWWSSSFEFLAPTYD